MALSHTLSRGLYGTALRILRAVSPAMMRGDSKLARGLRGRRDAHGRLAAWGRAFWATAAGAPRIVWVHASSVGESLQARAVIDVLRGREPGLEVVFTFFSPSAEVVCRDFPADICTYLPWDLPEVVGPALDAVRPSLIVFTQREVWPTLAAEAETRGIPTALIAGTMPAGAGRLSGPGKRLLGAAFESLSAVGAVSQEDGERFGILGVRTDRVTVTGDPGIDVVRDRAAGVDHAAPHMRIFGDEAGRAHGRGPILVAGSIWPSDEEVLLPALKRVHDSVPGLRIVLVPHEPEGYDFVGLGGALAADGWTPRLLGENGEFGEADALLVDRVGVLADLYNLATVAYVGGGFHSGGLHSVLEPAAAAVPVLIGPRYQGSVHATGLLEAGAACAVADAEALARALKTWLEAPGKNEGHSRRAMAYIEHRRGSAERTADLLAQFFAPRARPGTLSEGEI